MKINIDNLPKIGEYYQCHASKEIYQVLSIINPILYEIKHIPGKRTFQVSYSSLIRDKHLPYYNSPLYRTLLGCSEPF
jgi:hypothetical protein